MKAYHHSAATLNYARALVDGGFADLHHPQHWDLGFVRSQSHRAEYEDMVERIRDAIDFLESTGVRGTGALRTVELFSSHEGLLLDYEEALTEKVGDRYYNLGAHFLWIGDRTRSLGDAHLEYFRGIENPIGIKVGKQMQPNELVEIINEVEPANRQIVNAALVPVKDTFQVEHAMTDLRILPRGIAVIRMIGENVTIYLNGKLIVDDVTLENYWERNKPIYRSNQIELQNHGNKLYFKNIYIRELPY